MRLLEPITLGSRTASSRVMFGPHVTNLGDDERRLTDRHVAYYERRASGGAGVVVVEGASVHASDWPYERSPLASRCGPGWAAVVAACRPHGALVLASLDHTGGQGSSAYGQQALWAPSRVPEVNSREVPKWMEAHDIEAVVDGFGEAAALAVESGCDGVEINAGQHSLVRQFLSGLTNQRDDEWGHDRLLFARQVIESVRAAAGDAVVGLRLSCDELAPWAGITPEMAPAIAAELVDGGIDFVVVVRGSIFSIEKTRPDFHEPTGFNVEVCRAVHEAVSVPVFLQGSVVDVGQAEWALGGYDDPAVADGVEMTRAQIADPDLVAKVRSDHVARIRPCTRCNQTCQVRDARNPIVTCVGEPSSGRETEDPDWYVPAARPRHVEVVGGGPGGLETARVAALRGHTVTVHERSDTFGGLTAVAGPNRAITDWLESECRRLGVALHTDVSPTPTVELSARIDATAPIPADSSVGAITVQCTGSVAGRREYEMDRGAVVVDIADVRRGTAALPDEGDVVVYDPIGGPIGVAIAEELGARAILVTQDQIAGNELSRTGDLAPANVRLAQAGVRIEKRTLLRVARADGIDVDDRFSGASRTIPCVAVVDCGFRLPDDPIPGVDLRAGDCVAPRTLYEAILEARRVARSI
jgi:mycofactocin system FadH/OYE family oxidoreductase 1